MTSESVFAGEYPTLPEAVQALYEQGFGNHIDTVVTVPMDNSSGPLAEQLTRCRSAHLTQGWPKMFRAIVGQMVKGE